MLYIIYSINTINRIYIYIYIIKYIVQFILYYSNIYIYIYIYILLSFFFTGTDNSEDSKGSEGIIFYSTLLLQPGHEH